MIDAIFQFCVALLIGLAHRLDTSYAAVNVWIFCVLWPLFTLVLIGLVLWQRRTIQRLSRRAGDRRPRP